MASYILQISLINTCHFCFREDSTGRQWSPNDFYLVNKNFSHVEISWRPQHDEEEFTQVLEITAQPVDPSLAHEVRKNESDTNSVHLYSLRPFTVYKYIVREKDADAVLITLGPFRNWPSGKSHFYYDFASLPHISMHTHSQ